MSVRSFTTVTNEYDSAVALPQPLRGILAPGKSIILPIQLEDVQRLLPQVTAVFRTQSYLNYIGPFSGQEVSRFALSAGYQQVIYFNKDSGDDRNDGATPDRAIKTCAELNARLSGNTIYVSDVDVIFLTGNTPDDPIRIRDLGVFSPNPGGPRFGGAASAIERRVRFIGTQAIGAPYASGTFTAVQQQNRSANLPYVMTDTTRTNWAAPASFTTPSFFFPEVGSKSSDFQRVRISGGPRIGALSWTAAANIGAGFGGGQSTSIRVSNWNIPDPYGSGFITPITPQVGDPYVCEQLPTLFIQDFFPVGNDDNWGSGVYIQDFDIFVNRSCDSRTGVVAPKLARRGCSVIFINCLFESALLLNAVDGGSASYCYLMNCASIDETIASSGFSNYVDAGLFHGGLGAVNSGVIIIDGDAFIETGQILAGGQGTSDGTVLLLSAAVFDLPAHSVKAAVMALNGGRVLIGSGSNYGVSAVWGGDQGLGGPTRKFGLCAQDNGHICVDPLFPQAGLTVSGVQADFSCGLSESRGNQARAYDDSIPGLTSLRACSYVNYFKSIATGGFGGRVIDQDTGGSIGYITPVV